MSHVIMTCKNHPNLRWSTKEEAVSADGKYTGARNIFFNGTPSGKGMYADGSGLDCVYAEECNCPASDLVIAPENALVVR